MRGRACAIVDSRIAEWVQWIGVAGMAFRLAGNGFKVWYAMWQVVASLKSEMVITVRGDLQMRRYRYEDDGQHGTFHCYVDVARMM